MAKSMVTDFKEANDHGWSGKLELNTSWMLNRQKTSMEALVAKIVPGASCICWLQIKA